VNGVSGLCGTKEIKKGGNAVEDFLRSSFSVEEKGITVRDEHQNDKCGNSYFCRDSHNSRVEIGEERQNRNAGGVQEGAGGDFLMCSPQYAWDIVEIARDYRG